MIPQPSSRITTVVAASDHPDAHPSRKPSGIAITMGESATGLPARTRSRRTARSSHSSRSTSSSHEHQPYDHDRQHHYHQHANPNPTDRTHSSPAPAARPRLIPRTSSAPAIPQCREGGSRPGGGGDEAAAADDDTEASGDEDGDDEQQQHYHQPAADRPQRPEYRPRNSIASIKDDPFFRHYQTPHSVLLGRELMAATYEHQEDEDAELVSPLSPRPVKKPAVDEGVNLPPQSRSGLADINIAVIGSAGVGKSTLIQRALGLRALPTSIASSQRMSVDNVPYTVSLIEIELESFDINPERRIQWPKQINGHIVPRMDGALLLYDVMNRESIQELPQTLNALVKSNLPTILVSCKCDNPENTRQINVDSMEAACSACVDAVKTASNVPETARLSLSSMLRAIMAHRAANPTELAGPRRRATSSTDLEKMFETASINEAAKHGRANSDISLLQGSSVTPPVNLRGLAPTRGNGRGYHFTLPDPDDAPPILSHPAFRNDEFEEADPPLELASPPSAKIAGSSFLDMEESDAESLYRYSDVTPILQRNDDTFFDKPAKVAGVTFDGLVDRLLSQNMSRADNNFADIFLCLYRKFAAPSQLFAAILSRLESVMNDKNTHYLTRSEAQLRIVAVVAKWVSVYPGDFASPISHRNLEAFIAQLSGDPIFAAAAQEMRIQLRSRVVEDDETGWARTDDDCDTATNQSAPASPVRQKMVVRNEYEESNSAFITDASDEQERQVSVTESSGSGRAPSPTHSLSPSFHTVEDYEKEAATMIPKGMFPLTKFRYDIFMDTPDDDFADEITRIDWVMFSSIRVRDLVRHVSLPLDQKEKRKSLTNVNRMISHFNHIARWVANMIVIRDKAKHRARMLEKFMNVALKLRQLNNYNGLAAILAGINSSAVHRLAQTRALVPADIQKRFARLVLLMGTQKSHFAYRLAWENSSLPRVPFIPLHRRDLVSAEEGSRTFVGANGERINWKKFEVLAEVLLPIMKSQVVPYPNLTKREPANELILDCKMYDDDEDLYQRSVSLEGSSGGALEFGKKKLPWFQKEK